MSKPSKNHELQSSQQPIINRIRRALLAKSVSCEGFTALYDPECLEYIAQCSRSEYQIIRKRLEQVQGFDFTAFETQLAQFAVPDFTLLNSDGSPYNQRTHLEQQLRAIEGGIKFNTRMLDAENQSIQYYRERLEALEPSFRARGLELVALYARRDEIQARLDAITLAGGKA